MRLTVWLCCKIIADKDYNFGECSLAIEVYPYIIFTCKIKKINSKTLDLWRNTSHQLTMPPTVSTCTDYYIGTVGLNSMKKQKMKKRRKKKTLIWVIDTQTSKFIITCFSWEFSWEPTLALLLNWFYFNIPSLKHFCFQGTSHAEKTNLWMWQKTKPKKIEIKMIISLI